MTAYKEMYYILLNAITDAITQLQRFDSPSAVETLRNAKLKAEEYIKTEGK